MILDNTLPVNVYTLTKGQFLRSKQVHNPNHTQPFRQMNINSIIENHDYMSFAVIGPVNCGKTSFISMMRNLTSGSISKQRATTTTTVYREHAENQLSVLTENVVSIDQITMIERCKNVKVQLVDIPGPSASHTKEMCFRLLEQVFEHLSMIMLIFDINSAMNTDDERQLLKKVVELAQKAHADTGLKQSLFVIANKCDKMTVDDDGLLSFTDPEDAGLYKQLEDEVSTVINDIYPDLKWSMVKISAEYSLIYNSLLNRNTDQLDKKYRDKLGESVCARKWYRLSEAEQNRKLQSVTKEDAHKFLQESGYVEFKNSIGEYLSTATQFEYVSNKFKVYTRMLVESTDPTSVLAFIMLSPDAPRRLEHEPGSGDVLASDISSDFIDESRDFQCGYLEACRKYKHIAKQFGFSETGSSKSTILKLIRKSFEHAMNDIVKQRMTAFLSTNDSAETLETLETLDNSHTSRMRKLLPPNISKSVTSIPGDVIDVSNDSHSESESDGETRPLQEDPNWKTTFAEIVDLLKCIESSGECADTKYRTAFTTATKNNSSVLQLAYVPDAIVRVDTRWLKDKNQIRMYTLVDGKTLKDTIIHFAKYAKEIDKSTSRSAYYWFTNAIGAVPQKKCRLTWGGPPTKKPRTCK